MNWISVLRQAELPEGARRVVEASGHDILLIHREGQIHAVDSRCPHMRASLARAEITKDGAIVCPRHHSAFDLSTGEAKAWSPWPPAVGRILGAVSREKALPVFAVKVEQGSIWVGLEETT